MGIRKAQATVTRQITLSRREDVNALAAFLEEARQARFDHLTEHDKPLPKKLAAWIRNRPKAEARRPTKYTRRNLGIATTVGNLMGRGATYEEAVDEVALQVHKSTKTIEAAYSMLLRWLGETPRRGRKSK